MNPDPTLPPNQPPTTVPLSNDNPNALAAFAFCPPADQTIDVTHHVTRASAPLISSATVRDLVKHESMVDRGNSFYLPERNLSIAKYIINGTRDQLPIETITIGMGHFQKGFMCSFVHEALKADSAGAGGICAVSMRSETKSLTDQDNLFVVNTRTHGKSSYEVIGSVRESLWLKDSVEQEQIIARFADPNVRTVAIVITHSGYHLNMHGYLDIESDEIQRDLANPRNPSSIEGLLVEGLRARFDALQPREAKLLILPCDNVPAVRDPHSTDTWRGLGEMLHDSLVEYAYSTGDVELATRIRDYTSVPNTMIDRICPKPTARQEADLTQLCGIQDSHLVVTEPLPNPALIIERHRKGSPPLIDYNHKPPYSFHTSVRIEDQANGWRDMKTYTLNTAHVMVAWLGKYLGNDDSTADSIMESRSISQFIAETLKTCVEPIMDPSLFDSTTYEEYMEECLHRVRNHSLPDTLDRLDTKGTEKICERVMSIVLRNEKHLRDLKEAHPDARPILAKELERLALFVAVWARCVTTGCDSNGNPVRIHQDKKANQWQDPKYGDLSSEEQINSLLLNKSIFNASPLELPHFVVGFKKWLAVLQHKRLEEALEYFNEGRHLKEDSGLGNNAQTWVI